MNPSIRAQPEKIIIAVNAQTIVSGLLQIPPGATACCVLAHGAGAGMIHPFMAAVATGLSERTIATLRYQFPSMEAGSRRPDTPRVAHATVQAAVAYAAKHLPDLPLVAGGKSFGGRMTSQTEADAHLSGVKKLVFFGFPLHPAKKPATDRADHLAKVTVPMLFVQGDRDQLAERQLLEPLIKNLGERATLHLLAGADHAFHVPARNGRTQDQLMDVALQTVAEWIMQR